MKKITSTNPKESELAAAGEELQVKGRIAQPDGTGIANVDVQAFDKCLAKENLLARATTDREGAYELSYSADSLINPERGRADLLVRAFSGAGDLLASSPLIINALEQETVNLSVGDQAYRGPDLHHQMEQKLAEFLDGVAPHDIEPRDLYCLANSVDMPVEWVHHFIKAQQWAIDWDAFPAEVFFAWFRGGMAPQWGALLEQSPRGLTQRVQEAVAQNIVSPAAAEALGNPEPALNQWRTDYVVDSDHRPVSRASLGQLLQASDLSRAQQSELLGQWQTFEGSADDFWADQRQDLGDETADDLALTLQLGFLTRNHLPLVTALKTNAGIQQLGDLAPFQSEDWLALFDELDLEMPSDLQGADDTERRHAYAGALSRLTENLLPTRVLASAFSKDPEINSQILDPFIEDHPDFEFREQSIRQYLQEFPEALARFEDPKAAQRELEALQRVFHLSPIEDRQATAKILWQHQLHSAWAITLRGQSDFIELFGSDQELAQRIYQRAHAAQQINQTAWMQRLDHEHSLGYVLPQAEIPPATSSLQKAGNDGTQLDGIPDLASLFGEQGYCECDHCSSFFSPSAYLVDLFLYLQQAKLNPSEASPPVDTVLERLFERRPDLANIRLDCANAETPLPYIDLINEILENAVVPRSYGSQNITVAGKILTLPVAPDADPAPQTDVDTALLKAFPQHLNPAAYDILQQGDGSNGLVFPWNLPFNLWATEVRTLMNHLGVPRWRLMESPLGSGDAAEVACEYLGLEAVDKNILLDDSPSTERLKEYWGIAGSLSDLNPVETFLEHSQLTYAELRQWLSSRYLQGPSTNPPVSIRFDPESSCRLADAELDNLDEAALSRIHRFGRLLRRAQESPEMLDRALVALGGEISTSFLQDYVDLKRLEQGMSRRIDRAEVLTWWQLLDTHDRPGQASLYSSLFLDPSTGGQVEAELVLNADKTELQKVDDGQATVLDFESSSFAPDLQAHLLSAFQWTLPELRSVVSDQWGGSSFTLNLANLSYLFRVSSFSRALGLSVSDYLIFKAIFGTSPLAELNPATDGVRPKDTSIFANRVDRLRNLGLNAEILDYLLRHQSREGSPHRLSQHELGQILFQLAVLLSDLLNEPEIVGQDLRDTLVLRLARILTPEDVKTALAIVEIDPELLLTQQERTDFVHTTMTFFADPADAVAQLLNGGLTDIPDRYGYTLEALKSYLVENAAIQNLAEALKLDTQAVDGLLRSHLSHPSEPNQTAIQIFFDPIFLDSVSDSSLDASEFPDQAGVILRLQKIGLIAELLEWDADDLEFLVRRGAQAALPDLTTLPLEASSVPLPSTAFEPWQRLLELSHLQREHVDDGSSIFDPLRDAWQGGQTASSAWQRLASATDWQIQDIGYLAGSSGLGLNYPEDYRSAAWLVELGKVLPSIARVGASAEQMAQWTAPELTQAQAVSVRHATRAQYGHEDWLDVTAPLRDRIREQQRDALLSFVLHHRAKHDQSSFVDDTDLYGYYLVDPQMGACTLTSRTVLAMSSTQLFVQRILLNLETGMTLSRNHAEQWKWRKQYRVWEANRKVLLWPENWIEPQLRDDKSPFFQELENELLQDELNEENAERAYVSYLHKLHGVARLDIAGVCYESDTMHVFGRTADSPSAYFYRHWSQRRHWTPWEPVELDISNGASVSGESANHETGVLLLPVMHNRRLFLFWPVFTLKQSKPGKQTETLINVYIYLIEVLELEIQDLESQGATADEIADKKASIRELEGYMRRVEEGLGYFSIHMAYSEYRQGHWTAKRQSPEAIQTPLFVDKFELGADIHRYFFLPEITKEGDLTIHCHFGQGTTDYQLDSYFKVDACRDRVVAVTGYSFNTVNQSLPDPMVFMKTKDDASGVTVPLQVNNRAAQVDLLLNKAARGHLTSSSLDQGVFQHISPFIYEDERRAFLVVPPDPLRFTHAHPFEVSTQMVAGKAIISQSAAFEKAVLSANAPRAKKSQVQLLNGASEQTNYYELADEGSVFIRRSIELGGPQIDQAISAQYDLESMTFDDSAAQDGKVMGISPEQIQMKLTGEYVFRTFYHPYSCLFLEQLDRYGVDGVLNPDPKNIEGRVLHRQLTPDHLEKFNFKDTYDPNLNEVDLSKTPTEILSFDYQDPYAEYNWEVFFHIPLLIADRLHQEQRFEAAQIWLHYIFNPTESEGDAPYRFWKVKPFYTYSQEQMDQDLQQLLSGQQQDQIRAWEEDPFNPHLLARFRRLAYMKTTVMRYLDNLIAWADQRFRQDSIESINEATQLYVLAGQILGKLPTETETKQTESQTFSQLASELDSLANAWVEIETLQQPSNGSSPAENPSNGAQILVPYFCFPPNEKMLGYWEIVADRLFKIRHCMNIQGSTRQLPLFQPPIDPALLVRAAAAGIDLSSALNDLYAPTPKYRFAVMIQKAQEICQEVKALGGALLSALERKDAEALSLLRSRQETTLLKANRDIRAQRVKELGHQLQALGEQRELSQLRFENYDQRDFINVAESLAFGLARAGSVTQAVGAGVAAAGGAAHQGPDVYVGGLVGPLGGAIGLTHIAGGDKAGMGIGAVSQWINMAAGILRDMADLNSTMGNYQRRQEDWDLQRDLARQEMRQVDQQVLAAEIQIAVAEKEKDNLELQIEQSQTVADHFERKYTKEQLYSWMVGQISSIYFQSYQLAYDIAKQAEKAFHFELGTTGSNTIRFGYWDNLKKGLLSGDKLSLDLNRLEMAYLDAHQRELELSKHVSLRQLDPVALLELKTLGTCTVEVPEWLFDMDTPGHHHRRLKTVAVSIPAVTGPYVGVHCSLTLQKSTIRRSSALKGGLYPRDLEQDDKRFVDYFDSAQSVVTSHAQNDSGLFETNLRDERYLPFEGHGAISTWKLELPTELRQFDYDTISDIILHLRYTARSGGAELQDKAEQHVQSLVTNATETELTQLFSLRHDFPAEWHRFTAGENPFEAKITKHHFPYFMQAETLTLVEATVYESAPDQLEKVAINAVTLGQWNTALSNDEELSISLPESTVLPRVNDANVFLVVKYRA